NICAQTIRRRLRDAKVHCKPAAKKIELKPRHREQRMLFARQHLNTPQEEWNAIVWMDEKLFSSAKEEPYRVWRPKGQRLNPKYVLPSGTSGRIKLGFWRCMTSHELVELTEISPRMNAKEYVEILEEILKPVIRRIFPEDQYPITQDN
ncbi:Transposable element Tc1 transposase, partial [Camponotus floridanus]